MTSGSSEAKEIAASVGGQVFTTGGMDLPVRVKQWGKKIIVHALYVYTVMIMYNVMQ